ncbi:eukaryotic cytochrome b561-domain-containing protein [Lobosporangium transversale]|uniref:Eukaryotic cytochrome b561-domain-containing protein n=1 Tax=Lobosporangium transversale TaxID=64571 RepID=A0A1Y2GNL0_9FUNG|nr:eukaryotic cytochrome b561-domain-containing protein [Lobosporangium transversale]ORZ14947.1 eukaryotic cytochrome b561-domain-containing protein [Lobosporangium transversale]|eukprot:XP_021881079.1 eukaryotic cytochrome b561-domain-containing protein [Lobosporangium transversale]
MTSSVFYCLLGILLLQPIEKASQKRAARTVHGILQILALIFSLIGFVAIYRNKDLKKKVHFHTNHALLGCAAVAVFFLQVLFGVLVAYAPRRMFSCIGYARVLRIHRVAGYVSIVLMWGTFWLSVLTNWMKTNFANHEWVFALGMGMIAVGIVGQVTPSRLWLSRSSNNSSNNNSNNKRSLVQSNADNSFSP